MPRARSKNQENTTEEKRASVPQQQKKIVSRAWWLYIIDYCISRCANKKIKTEIMEHQEQCAAQSAEISAREDQLAKREEKSAQKHREAEIAREKLLKKTEEKCTEMLRATEQAITARKESFLTEEREIGNRILQGKIDEEKLHQVTQKLAEPVKALIARVSTDVAIATEAKYFNFFAEKLAERRTKLSEIHKITAAERAELIQLRQSVKELAEQNDALLGKGKPAISCILQ